MLRPYVTADKRWRNAIDRDRPWPRGHCVPRARSSLVSPSHSAWVHQHFDSCTGVVWARRSIGLRWDGFDSSAGYNGVEREKESPRGIPSEEMSMKRANVGAMCLHPGGKCRRARAPQARPRPSRGARARACAELRRHASGPTRSSRGSRLSSRAGRLGRRKGRLSGPTDRDPSPRNDMAGGRSQANRRAGHVGGARAFAPVTWCV